jgi:hypothetical protein
MGTPNDLVRCALCAVCSSSAKLFNVQQTKMLTNKEVFFKRFDGNQLIE